MSKSEFSRLSDLIPKLQREDEARCDVALIDLKELRYVSSWRGVAGEFWYFFQKKVLALPGLLIEKTPDPPS